jgi:O-antigen/teichoic acid export membrane protein
MGIFALISLSECLLRLFVVILIGVLPIDGLVFYAGGLFAVSVVIFSLYAIIGHHRYAECRYHGQIPVDIYKSLLSFSGWTVYSALAAVGMTQGITILLYMFFGPVATAAYAISTQVLHAFQTLSNSIVVAFRPAMVKSYAEKDYAFLDKMFVSNNKFILYLLLMVAIPLILELRTIFSWWLGDVSEETIVFTRLIIIYMVCLSMHNPVTTIVQSTGQIKYYSLFVDSILLLCLPATWLAFHFGALSDTCIVLMLIACILAHVVRLIILKRLYPQFRYRSYLLAIMLPGIASAVMTALVTTLVHNIMEPGIMKVITVFAVSSVILMLAFYVIGMSKEERSLLHQKIASL